MAKRCRGTLAGQTDAGQLLDQEQMLRLFDLSAQVKDLPSSFKFATINFEKQFAEVQAKILNQQETRNNEYFDEEIEKRQEKIAKANKFKITDHSMQLYGICESCQ